MDNTSPIPGQHGSHAAAGHRTEEPERFHATDPEPEPSGAPRGPAVGTIVFGLICLAVAGLVIAYQVAGITVDWDIAGPTSVIGIGAILVVIGLLSLARRRDRTDG